MSGIEILVDDRRGQYIPQFFAEYCSAEWDCIYPDDIVHPAWLVLQTAVPL